jgi:nicotinamidase/pyrazinamidase
MNSGDLSRLARDPNTALVVVDQQIDFEPGGALAVAGGDEIVHSIAQLMRAFENVILTQDSHPSRHISFASSYSLKRPFDVLTADEIAENRVKPLHHSREVVLAYLKRAKGGLQVLWPDHCVQGSPGCALDPRLPLERAMLILRKGNRIDCDSYSAFFENDGSSTGLGDYLNARGLRRLVIVGLAGDYCVAWSALDARRLGFEVVMPLALTRFVEFPAGSREKALAQMSEANVLILD